MTVPNFTTIISFIAWTTIMTMAKSRQNTWKGMSDIATEHVSLEPNLIFGSIPTDIKGSLFVNGAGRIKLSDNLFYEHWFDGDGMATVLKFDGNGKIPKYTSKFIKTPRYEMQGNETSHFKTRGAWTQASKWHSNILSQPTNPSNTMLIHFNGKLLSLCEGGKPILLNADTLDTIDNEYSFNNQLNSFFSAHPKIYFNDDENENVLINFGISIQPPSTSFYLNLFSIKADETEQFIAQNRIKLPYNCLIHDFLVTDRFIIFLISPYVISTQNILKSVLFGMDSLGNYQEWKEELGSYVYVFDKFNLSVLMEQKIQKSISFWHWINGYDDEQNENIYLRLLAFPSSKRSELEHRMKHLFNDDSVSDVTADLFGGIVGLNINLSNQQIDILPLDELNAVIDGFELHEINEKYVNSKDFQFIFGNSISPNGKYLDSLQKIDVKNNVSTVYTDIEHNIYLSGPQFISAATTTETEGEDNGYIVCYAYSVNDDMSMIYIFNASNISLPLAIMQMENVNLPLFFHGNFVQTL